ncbi:hypothetical protein [Fischerella thermalis]|uniref:hypothetical protein n=1 Tax=Fischerella thermalis TaxID=372787 RepID=UPI0012FCCC16|nr:hypothetical protein [Fischerella thermalis]
MEPVICLKRSRAATIINYGRRVAEGFRNCDRSIHDANICSTCQGVIDLPWNKFQG